MLKLSLTDYQARPEIRNKKITWHDPCHLNRHLGIDLNMKLDKSIDEPVDLYLRDTKFATGSVVVVDDQFAVKIEQILGLGDSADKSNEATV